MMTPPVIPSDWPDDLAVPVVSPAAYLRAQASYLHDLTGGTLVGDLAVTTRLGSIRHTLEIVCPALHGYRAVVLSATHQPDFPYPVQLEFSDALSDAGDGFGPEVTAPSRADSYVQFREAARQVLKTPSTVSLLQSLIARSNDAKLATT